VAAGAALIAGLGVIASPASGSAQNDRPSQEEQRDTWKKAEAAHNAELRRPRPRQAAITSIRVRPQ